MDNGVGGTHTLDTRHKAVARREEHGLFTLNMPCAHDVVFDHFLW